MALQDILKKVLEEAAKNVSEIEAETQESVSVLQAQIEALETEELNSLTTEKEEQLLSIKKSAEASARREQKKFQLAAKCEVLESALESFYGHLLDLSDAEYSSIISALMVGVDADGTLMVPASRLDVTKKAVKGDLKIESTDEIKGGFIFKADSLSVDNSFKNVVFSEYKTVIESFFAQKLGLI